MNVLLVRIKFSHLQEVYVRMDTEEIPQQPGQPIHVLGRFTASSRSSFPGGRRDTSTAHAGSTAYNNTQQHRAEQSRAEHGVLVVTASTDTRGTRCLE